MILLVEIALETSVILLIALGLVAALRRQSAALRHCVLATAIACAIAAPAVGRFVPQLAVPIPVPDVLMRAAPAAPGSIPAPVRADAPRRPASALAAGQPAHTPWARIVLTAWLVGFSFPVALIAAGLLQLVRLRARATPMTAGVWFDLTADLSREYGIRRAITLLESPHPSMLVTWGFLRPKLIVPAAAREWPAERVRLVLAHELAHIRRGDWIVQLGAELFKAAFWFNPLAWLASARLRRESEQACDDAVINGGIRSTDYAEHLLDIARELKQGRILSPAAAIARSSTLERRVRAMLDQRLNRRPLSRLAYVFIFVILVAATVPAAGLATFEQVFGSLSGSITDKTNGVMPGVTLVLTNTQTGQKYEVVTDRTGRYQFQGLVQGDYTFEAKLPGFAAFQGKLTVAGQSLQQDVTMEVGSLRETIHVSNSRSNPATASVTASAALAKRPIPPCGSGPAASAPPIGGNIRAPRKLKDVRPLYPAALASKGIEGTVELVATIDTDGNVSNLTVASAAHPELASAASDAVKQWEFDATILNCVPIAVRMDVTVTFSLKP